MSVATLPPSPGGKKKAPNGYTLNGAYYRRKIERGVEHKIHAGGGKEYVRVRGTRPDGRRYDVSQPITSLKELRDVAARIKTEMASGTHVEPSRVTVASLWDSWKEEWESLIASGERSPRSLVNVQGRIRKYVIPTIGTMRVTEVRSHHVVKVLNAGRTAELSSSSLDSLRDVCSGLLQHGVDTGVVQRNVGTRPSQERQAEGNAEVRDPGARRRRNRASPRSDTQGRLPRVPDGPHRARPARGRVPWPSLGKDRLGDEQDLRHPPARSQRTRPQRTQDRQVGSLRSF